MPGKPKNFLSALVATVLLGFASLSLLWPEACNKLCAQDGGGATAAPDYTQHIAPLFQKYCVGCHNPQEMEGDLVLTTYAQALAGAGGEPIWVAGDPTKSRLAQVLQGEEPAMPPQESPQPTAEEVALLIAWITHGAAGPVGPDLPVFAPLDPIPVQGPVRDVLAAVALHPQAKVIALGRAGRVELMDPAARTLVKTLESGPGQVNALVFDPAGQKLYAATGEPGKQGRVLLWDWEKGERLREFTGPKEALYSLAVSPNGEWIAAGGYDASLTVWNAASGAIHKQLAGHNGGIYALDFNVNGQWLVSASGDRTVKVWHFLEGKRLDTFAQPLKDMYAVRFSKDGTLVLAAGGDNRLRQWKLGPEGAEGTNVQVYSKVCHQAPIVALDVSPDGKYVVTTAEDQSLRISNLIDASEVAVLPKQSDQVVSVAIAQDSQRFAVARLDGTWDLYALPGGELIPATPTLQPLELLALQIGQQQITRISGTNFASATVVRTSHPQLLAEVVQVVSPTELEVRLQAGAELTRGDYQIWLENAGQLSEKQTLYLDELPQVVAAEQPEPVQLAGSTSVWGRLETPGDTDSYLVSVEAGQTLVADVQSLLPEANLTAALYDKDGTSLVVAQNDGQNLNPLLTYPVTASGNYLLRISEHTLRGSDKHQYRVNVGPLPFVSAVRPLAIQRGQESAVKLVGFNLPEHAAYSLVAKGGEDSLLVPLDVRQYRARSSFNVKVDNWASVAELEPNQNAPNATPLAIPGAADGVLHEVVHAAAGSRNETAADIDHYRFHANAGETWVVEILGARQDSPIDSVIEILDAEGKPVPQVLLQAVRDSITVFRPSFSQQTGFRVTNWEEMYVDQYLYINGEVCRIFRQPQGPDSDTIFYDLNGKRRGYFFTTPISHALEESVYVVIPRPTGTRALNNGLPAFVVNYVNDDDSFRKLGSDSKLIFTAPATADYVIRVQDTRGLSDPRLGYRLIVRPVVEDFSVQASLLDGQIPRGNGRRLELSVDREDGFEGEVNFRFTDIPAGLLVPESLRVQPGHDGASTTVHAMTEAKPGNYTLRGEATGQLQGKSISKPFEVSLSVTEQEPGVQVFLSPNDVVIAPGTTVTCQLRVDRNGFKDRIQFDVTNLPHGVIVDNIGLSGVLLPEGQTERTLYLTAEPWVPEGSRTFQATASIGGNPTSLPITLHVRGKPSVVAN